MQKSFVPLLFSRPKEENHLAPRLSIVGTTAIDSTLFTVVGQPQTPVTAGNAGNILVIINNEVRGKIGKFGEVVDSITLDYNFKK